MSPSTPSNLLSLATYFPVPPQTNKEPKEQHIKMHLNFKRMSTNADRHSGSVSIRENGGKALFHWTKEKQVKREIHLLSGLGWTFFSSISLLAALFFSARASPPPPWALDTGSVAILSTDSTSTVATFISPPTILFNNQLTPKTYFFYPKYILLVLFPKLIRCLVLQNHIVNTLIRW